MEKINEVIWFYSFEFLSLLKEIRYDSVPINTLLLREFQKYILKNYKYIPKPNINENIKNIQFRCQPFLFKTKPNFKRQGYTLVRANIYPITSGVKDENFIFLAHSKDEFLNTKKNIQSSLVLDINDLPEIDISLSEEKDLLNRINQLLLNKSTFFNNQSFRNWLMGEVRNTLVLIRKVHYLFDFYPIKRIVYGSTINKNGSLISTFAQSRQINTINIQHGIFGEVGHLPINADLNLVWGNSDKDYLISYGVHPEKVKVVGPYFYKKERTKLNPLYGREIGTVIKKLNIIVALQPLGTQFNRTMIKAIELATKEFSSKVFIKYKLHPDQKEIKTYTKCLINKNSVVIPHGKIQLIDLLQTADLIITPFSSVAYEAILYRKPVVFYGKRQNFYFLKNKPCYVHNVISIKKLIQKILSDHLYLSKIKVILKDLPSEKMDNKYIWKVILNFEKNF